MKKIDIIGKKYGRLTVISYDHNNGYIPYFLCKCDCGNTKVIQKYNLIEGKTLSCGCYHKEQIHKTKFISENRRALTRILRGMKERCYNPNTQSYHSYGGRGITICDEWLADTNAFCSWAESNGYKKGLSIERIDVNQGYNPQNCKWIPMSEQCYNLRKSVKITFNGKTQTLAQWADELGIPHQTLHNRIRVHNWSIERALTTPCKGH